MSENLSSDRTVFVTEDDRRARRLRRGAFVAATLAVLWVVGLGVGMFGFGGLPGISLGKRNNDAPDRARGEPVAEGRSADARSLASDQPLVVSRRSNLQRGSLSRARGRVQAPTPPPAAKPVAPPPAQQPVNPAGRQRGWARKGLPAPPGQVRKAQPKPPPGGRGRGQGQTTTTTTTPVPPGQAKKTPPPPPPEG
jgi:hypothetical protein